MHDSPEGKRLAEADRLANEAAAAAALALYEDELARRPDDVAILLDIANQMADLGREQEAVMHLRRGIGLARADASQELLARLHYTLGRIQQGRGETDDAVAQFHQTAPLADWTGAEHEAFFARMGLSLVALEKGDFGHVEKLLREARTYAGPGAPAKRRLILHTRQAEYLAATGHPRRAEAEFQSAVDVASQELDPADSLVAMRRLAEFHRRTGRIDKAERVFHEAVQMAVDVGGGIAAKGDPGDSETEANLLVWLAWRNLEEERLDEAEECARRARAAARRVEIADTRRDAEQMLARIREKRAGASA